ncbi:neuroserpin-like, partial [Hyposmocoma kahamanoa]|uniref:neuroserpin-like n=1 Tax=Hyposmocoma kahamanoa TaxID=1477025 RepID=UPI000E6D8F52
MPLAIRFAMCKLASVSVDAAKVELMTALGLGHTRHLLQCFQKLRENFLHIKESDMMFVNKLYLNQSSNIDPAFYANSSEIYGIHVDTVGFQYPTAATKYINRIISTMTYRRIQDILTPTDINTNTSMLLLSAIHYKPTWETPFDLRETRPYKFIDMDNNIILIDMVTTTDQFLYMENLELDFKMFTMLLYHRGTSITYVVPNKRHGLTAILETMKHKQNLLFAARAEAKYEIIKITIPKMKIKNSIYWNDTFLEMGMNEIYSSNTYCLNKILKEYKDKPIYLSQAKQKVFFELDEYGTYRVPMEQNVMDAMRDIGRLSHSYSTEVRADRPFLFFVNL